MKHSIGEHSLYRHLLTECCALRLLLGEIWGALPRSRRSWRRRFLTFSICAARSPVVYFMFSAWIGRASGESRMRWLQRMPRCRVLGPVDKLGPETNASEQDEAKETARGLVVSSGNTPLLLEMANEAFDA